MNPLTREWLDKADEDYGIAVSLLRRKKIPANTICFHLQQAAEKYMKAVLQERRIRFGRTHDLVELLDLLAPDAGTLPLLLDDLKKLTTYAVLPRYPEFNTTPQDARAAVAAMKKIRTAAKGLF
jgi:HEPN domain-containing protein